MTYFTLFINFIEVFLFSGFIAYTFNLKKKNKVYCNYWYDKLRYY